MEQEETNDDLGDATKYKEPRVGFYAWMTSCYGIIDIANKETYDALYPSGTVPLIDDVTISVEACKDKEKMAELGKLKPYYRYTTPLGGKELSNEPKPHQDEVKEYNNLLDKYNITPDEIKSYLEQVKKYEDSNNGTQAQQVGKRLSVDREADGVDKSGNK
jgi:hypothetical protein